MMSDLARLRAIVLAGVFVFCLDGAVHAQLVVWEQTVAHSVSGPDGVFARRGGALATMTGGVWVSGALAGDAGPLDQNLVIQSFGPGPVNSSLDLYDGGGSQSLDRGMGLGLLSDGGLVTTGRSEPEADRGGIVLIRYLSDGTRSWVRTIEPAGAGEYMEPLRPIVDLFDNIYVFARVRYVSPVKDEVLIAQYDAAGVKQWETRFVDANAFDGSTYGVEADISYVDDVLYFVGNVLHTSDMKRRMILYSVDPVSGVVSARLGFSPGSFLGLDAVDLVVASSGDVFLLGEMVLAGERDVYLARIKPSILPSLPTGALPLRYLSPGTTETAYRLVVDLQDNLYVLANTRTVSPLGNRSLLLLSYTNSGAQRWERRYNVGDSIGSDLAYDPVLDQIYLTGSIGTAGGSDLIAQAYNASDGRPVWNYRYGGNAGGQDMGVSVAFDAGGSAFVVGVVENLGSGPDLFAARLQAWYRTADLNQDFAVGGLDLAQLLSMYGQTGAGNLEDLDTSLAVDQGDVLYLLEHYGD